MEPNPSSKPKRRLRFSLRTLMIVVVVYGGLWAVTGVWGGKQLEHCVADYAKTRSTDANRTDMVQVRWMLTSSDGIRKNLPAREFWAANSVAYAPFLIRFEYAYRVKQLVPIAFIDSEVGTPEPQYLEGSASCYFLWFFGAMFTISRSAGEPIFRPEVSPALY